MLQSLLVGQRLSPFSSLKFRNYGLFWWGGLLSEVGSQMQVVAVNWQIYELTHSAIALGIIGLVSFIPIIIFSLPAGLIIDKADRKLVLIYSQIFPALCALMLFIATYLGIATPTLIYIMIALSFVARSFQAPARNAIIPQLVPKEYFLNAISLNVMLRQSGLVIGPAIGGFMISFWGVQSIYLLNAISFLMFIAALIPIPIKGHSMQSEVEYSLKSLWGGIHHVFSNQILLYTMALDFLANFFSSAMTLMPVFAKDILQVGPQGLGLLYAAPAIGSVITGLIIGSLGHIKNQGKIITLSVVLYGLATIGFGLSRSFYLSVIFLTLLGIGDMISTVLRNTIRQILTPDYLRGRMVAVNMIFVQGGPQIGETEAGLLAAFVGTPLSVALGGAATVLLTLCIIKAVPTLWNYHGDELRV